MWRTGETTLMDVDDARVQSLEEANGDESGSRRLLLADLAAVRLSSRRARPVAPAAGSSGPRQGVRGSSKWLAGDGLAWLISTINDEGPLCSG